MLYRRNLLSLYDIYCRLSDGKALAQPIWLNSKPIELGDFMKHYAALPLRNLNAHAHIVSTPDQAVLTLDSPAVHIMTDLRQRPAVYVDKDCLIDDAHKLMIQRAIRLLFIVHANEFLGIVTAKDILGERPTKLVYENQRKRNEITVYDIMTAKSQLICMELATLQKAEVGNLVSTMREVTHQHLLIVNQLTDKNIQTDDIVGLVSTSQIARLLNQPLDTLNLPSSFYAVQKALSE